MRTKQVALIVSILLLSGGLVMGQTVWEQYPGNPILGPGEPGAWDEWGCSIAAMVFHGGTYHMWYTSITPDNMATDIGHATSPDGIVWTKELDPVLTRGAPEEWDGEALRRAAVIHDGTQFQMWYEGWDADRISRVGYATSPDGSVWTKYPDNPVMDAGAPGEWDEWGPESSSVVADANLYKMWYCSSSTTEPGRSRVGYAESPDGINWTKHPVPVFEPSAEGWDSGSVWNPKVIFDESTYHMWYAAKAAGADGFEDGVAIGYAGSSDGLTWTRYDGIPVVESSTGYAYTFAVIFDSLIFRMWYTYWDGAVTDYVGYATSQADTNLRFIPAAAFASGAEGAFFQTDVDVNNAGGQSATYHFMWLPRGEDNSEPVSSENFNLGAGMSARYNNVLSEVFDLEPDAVGALAIEASNPDLLAMSRTYNTPSGKAAGTFGQAIPAVPLTEFTQSGERQRILFASENADLRTNIGCQNGSDATTVVRLELFDAGGTSLETRQMNLPPLSNKQFNRVFQDYQPVNGCVDVWTDTPDGSFYCYGSVLDNVTSDPTTILPQ